MLGLLTAFLWLSPRVSLLTMGEAPMLYERYGHTALLVQDEGQQGLVYNFGTTDFERSDLVTAFLRGHVEFWLSVWSYRGTLAAYRQEDRTIYLQDLDLPAERHAWLAERLAWLALPEHRAYQYDHFTENCATRVRDLIDEAAGGKMKKQLTPRPFGRTYRDLMLEGLGGLPALQIAADLVVGQTADRPLNLWHSGFLPRYVRETTEQVRMQDGAPLASEPRVLYARRGSPPIPSPWLTGRRILLLAALALIALGLLARRRPGLARTLRIGWGIVGGLAGLVLFGLAAYSTLPLIRENALLLVILPVDLWLFRLRSAHWQRRYGLVRLALILAVLLALHPPAAVTLMVAAGLFAATSPALLQIPPRLRRAP